MARAVVTGGNTVAAGLVLRIHADREGDPLAMNLQCGAIEVFEGVGVLVVVRVERRARVTAPDLRLVVAHLLFGAGEQAPGRDSRLREGVVVRAPVEAGVARLLAGAA